MPLERTQTMAQGVDVTGNSHKAYRRGTHRFCSPEETYERLRELMPQCGITRLANITGLDCVGVPVFVAVRPNARALSTAQGKGIDKAAARTSAMMEAFESWHGERVVGDGCFLRQAEVLEMRGIRTIDVARVTRRGAAMAWVASNPLNWVLGSDLLSGSSCFVPYDCVSNDLTSGAKFTPIVRSTNGLASGNIFTEAVLHGIYEVIERDAVSLWRPGVDGGDHVVDLASIGDAYNHELLMRLRKAGLDVLIRRVPSDTHVPVFCAVVTPGKDRCAAPFAAFSGFGAHLDPQVAVARAVTEAVQSRLTLIHGSRDDLWPSQYSKVLDHRAVRWWAGQVQSYEGNTSLGDIPDQSTDAFETDLRVVLNLLRPIVDEVAVVDLTRDYLGIPVVKVVIPGLSGIPFEERPRAGGRTGPSETAQ